MTSGDELAWLSAWTGLPPETPVFAATTAAQLVEFHRRPPDPVGAEFNSDVIYDAGHDLRLHVYRRADPTEPRPAIVLVHGGGWTSFDARMHIRYAHALAERGFVAATVNFRQLPDGAWPNCVEDVKRAVRWIRAHAAGIGADPERVGIAGNSAGGHLAALVALTPGRNEGAGGWSDQSSAVSAAFLLYPVTDVRAEAAPGMTEAVAGLLGADAPPERVVDASPVDQVHAACPPILTLTGSDDELTPLSMITRFHDVLGRAGVPHRLQVVGGAAHAFDWAPAGWQVAADAMIGFFEEQLCPVRMPPAQISPQPWPAGSSRF